MPLYIPIHKIRLNIPYTHRQTVSAIFAQLQYTPTIYASLYSNIQDTPGYTIHTQAAVRAIFVQLQCSHNTRLQYMPLYIPVYKIRPNIPYTHRQLQCGRRHVLYALYVMIYYILNHPSSSSLDRAEGCNHFRYTIHAQIHHVYTDDMRQHITCMQATAVRYAPIYNIPYMYRRHALIYNTCAAN